MMDNPAELINRIAIWAIPVLFAITVHEAAHGWMANKFGDKTALMLGRVTLNPIKHIDLIGTVLVPLLFLLTSNFIFGWAKPVPVNWRNLRNMRRDAALVALAGPGSNLLMAFFWGLIARLAVFGVQAGFDPMKLFVLMGIAGIEINLMILLLNLIPIPPLDGSRVIEAFLPPRMALKFDAISPYGILILVLLMFTGIFAVIIGPPYYLLFGGIFHLFGLSSV